MLVDDWREVVDSVRVEAQSVEVGSPKTRGSKGLDSRYARWEIVPNVVDRVD